MERRPDPLAAACRPGRDGAQDGQREADGREDGECTPIPRGNSDLAHCDNARKAATSWCASRSELASSPGASAPQGRRGVGESAPGAEVRALRDPSGRDVVERPRAVGGDAVVVPAVLPVGGAGGEDTGGRRGLDDLLEPGRAHLVAAPQTGRVVEHSSGRDADEEVEEEDDEARPLCECTHRLSLGRVTTIVIPRRGEPRLYRRSTGAGDAVLVRGLAVVAIPDRGGPAARDHGASFRRADRALEHRLREPRRRLPRLAGGPLPTGLATRARSFARPTAERTGLRCEPRSPRARPDSSRSTLGTQPAFRDATPSAAASSSGRPTAVKRGRPSRARAGARTPSTAGRRRGAARTVPTAPAAATFCGRATAAGAGTTPATKQSCSRAKVATEPGRAATTATASSGARSTAAARGSRSPGPRPSGPPASASPGRGSERRRRSGSCAVATAPGPGSTLAPPRPRSPRCQP